MQETSLSLLASIRQSNDAQSWIRLVELYSPLMKGWLSAYRIQGADADDLVQEVLAFLSQELPGFDHNQRTGAFRNWLRRILVHRMQNYWRSNRRRQPAQGGSQMLQELAELEDDQSGLSRIWDQQHDRDVVARLLQLVRPRFQSNTWEAFHRQMFQGQNPAQVAQELGMTIGSVYMARSRVLACLRAEADGLVDTL